MKKLSYSLVALSLTIASVGFAADATTTQKKPVPARPVAKPVAKGAPRAAAPRAAAPKKFVRNYGMAGCGLGSMVMGKKDNQIFAATTNGTSGNQTFGISTGTLNCVDTPTHEVAGRMDSFIAANKVAVASDMARGEGETLKTLSSMMGCDADLGASMQKNFKEIFPTADVQPNLVTDSIISVIQSDAELSSKCKQVS